MSAGDRRWVLASTMGAALMSLSACAGDADTRAAPEGPPSADVRIGLVEWGFTKSARALVAAPSQLRVTNAGATPHDLELIADDRVLARVSSLRPGEQETMTADLSGLDRVKLLCTLPGHRSQGMVEEIDVVAPTDTEQSEGRDE